MAGRLKWWLASVPAGIGLATARSIIRLTIGFNPARSGVYSAGNGPLMRAPVIGVWHSDDNISRNRFVDASTLMTHRDPRSIECARLIATAAALVARQDQNGETSTDILNKLENDISCDEMKIRFPILRQALQREESVSTFADRIIRKPGYVTGFAPDSTAVAIYAWLRHRNDFRATIESVIFAGGDTDTNAFVAGSLAGIECGVNDLPDDWIKNLQDWPINPASIKSITHGTAISYPFWPLSLLRNFAFLAIVISHGFRRLLPPY